MFQYRRLLHVRTRGVGEIYRRVWFSENKKLINWREVSVDEIWINATHYKLFQAVLLLSGLTNASSEMLETNCFSSASFAFWAFKPAKSLKSQVFYLHGSTHRVKLYGWHVVHKTRLGVCKALDDLRGVLNGGKKEASDRQGNIEEKMSCVHWINSSIPFEKWDTEDAQ